MPKHGKKHHRIPRIHPAGLQILVLQPTEPQYRRNRALKATGIVRRIDELGRVVIPKEIRRTLRIREGDPLEITLENKQAMLIGIIEVANRMGNTN